MNNEFITINGSKGEVKMSKVEYARWLCLIEAIDLVERKASDLKADMISDDFWIKPLAFQKYIDQRLETMIIDVDREEFNVSLEKSIAANKHLFKPTEECVEIEAEAEEEIEEPVMPVVEEPVLV